MQQGFLNYNSFLARFQFIDFLQEKWIWSAKIVSLFDLIDLFAKSDYVECHDYLILPLAFLEKLLRHIQ